MVIARIPSGKAANFAIRLRRRKNALLSVFVIDSTTMT
jgi:hypothetical protein